MTTAELAARPGRLPLSRFRRRVFYGLVLAFSVSLPARAWNRATLFTARLLTGAGLAAVTCFAHLRDLVPGARIGSRFPADRIADVDPAGSVLQAHYCQTAEPSKSVRVGHSGFKSVKTIILNGLNPVAVDGAGCDAAQYLCMSAVDGADQLLRRAPEPVGAQPQTWARLREARAIAVLDVDDAAGRSSEAVS